MRLPTKARYGVRAMLDLAVNNGEEEPVLMRDVALRQNLSEKYLEQILIPLRNAGLVRGVRGAKGGYMLTRSPSSINLLEIVEACIGDVTMVDCVEDPEYCQRIEGCATFVIWKELTETIREFLESKTLNDLTGIQRDLNGTNALLYYI